MAKRIFIIGGPNTGKSTLAEQLSFERGIKDVLNTDALIGLGWSEASAEAARFMDREGDYIVEGCATARALRKWMANNPGKPFEPGTEIRILNLPFQPQTKNQQAMAKGMYTVMTEIYGECVSRGATFEQPEKRDDQK